MPNDVKLQEGHPVDENLRPLKVGGKSTALETAQWGDGAKVNGNLTVKGDALLDDVECNSLDCKKTVSAVALTGTGSVPIFLTNDPATITTTNLTIDDSAGITLDSATGVFKLENNGTEFSPTDSAYSGMILGYTRIANDGTSSSNNIITIASGVMTVIQTDQGTDLSIQFIVPPSGNVEIQCSFWMNAASRGAKFSLSTDPSYAELGITHTYDADQTIYIDETDHNIMNISFAVTGLVAGTDTTYYLAGLASGSNTWINHGRFRLTGNHYPPIILKAIALPATIVTGE
tara:strand:- start:171 stop:1037 length:867 start_codon:yes stop_codon:yes gene_type:complete